MEIHHNSYDYSKSCYVHSKYKLVIICKKHGAFTQRPSDHLKGQGCPICKSERASQLLSSNISEFIKKSKSKYGDRYDYSNSVYVNSWTPLKIICPIHGEFEQTPAWHLSRKLGCSKCGNKLKNAWRLKNTSDFIRDAKRIHKNKYDYSKSSYVGALKKIEIICPIHESFFQTPNGHLNGHGCYKCGNNTRTTKTFISDASKIHNNLYDYSEVNYIDLVHKVAIKCKLHGTFYQTPNSHLKGSGCPKCKKSKGETTIENYLIAKKVSYETPKTFRDCINPKTGWNLYYDFYLPSKNILIEYDGYQHYLPYHRDKFNLDSLTERKYRDKLKNKWERKNKIKLIRIKYTAIKRIPEILDGIFPNPT